MIKERGFKKENLKRLFKWHGFWYEIVWVVFFACLFFSVWAYKRDVGLCNEVLEDPCFAKCVQELYGGTQNRSVWRFNISDFNLSQPNNSNGIP